MLDAEELCNRGRDDGHGGRVLDGQCYVVRSVIRATRRVRRGQQCQLSNHTSADEDCRGLTPAAGSEAIWCRSCDSGACLPPTARHHEQMKRKDLVWMERTTSVHAFEFESRQLQKCILVKPRRRCYRLARSRRRHRDLTSDRASFPLRGDPLRVSIEIYARGNVYNFHIYVRRFSSVLHLYICTLATFRFAIPPPSLDVGSV